MDDLPEIQDIKRITYNPDDVIVVRCVQRISAEQALMIKTRLRETFPSQKIVILDPAFNIDVVAPE